MTEVQHVTVNRTVVRTVILVLAAIVIAAVGIAILVTHGKHLIGEAGAGFIATAVAFAAVAL